MEVLICLCEHPPCNVVLKARHVVRSNVMGTGTEVLLAEGHRAVICWKGERISCVALLCNVQWEHQTSVLYRGGYFVLCKIDNILCCNVNLSFALLSGLHFVLFGIAFTHLFNFTCHNRNISFHMLNNHPCLQHRCEK